MSGPACFAVSGLRFPVRAPHAMLARRAAAQKKQQRRKSYLQCMRRREKQGAAKGTMGALLNEVGTHSYLRGPAYKLADKNSRVCGLAAGKTLASKICTPVCPERLKAVSGSSFGRIESNFGRSASSAKVRGSPKKRCTQALQRSERAVISRRAAQSPAVLQETVVAQRSQIF